MVRWATRIERRVVTVIPATVSFVLSSGSLKVILYVGSVSVRASAAAGAAAASPGGGNGGLMGYSAMSLVIGSLSMSSAMDFKGPAPSGSEVYMAFLSASGSLLSASALANRNSPYPTPPAAASLTAAATAASFEMSILCSSPATET